jgi:hypothetical protein
MAREPEKMVRNAGAGAIHRTILVALIMIAVGMLLVVTGLATGVLVHK